MKEKAAPLWPKIAAVVCSVALAGGYVGWRKHQADKTAERASKAQQEETDETPTLMVGSKNPGRDLIIDFENLSDNEKAEFDRVLMSSSKTMVMSEFIELDEVDLNDFGLPIDSTSEAETPDAEAENSPRTLIPSSKRIDAVFRTLPESEREPEDSADTQEP